LIAHFGFGAAVKSVRFGIAAIIICATVVLAARVQVVVWEKEAETSTERQDWLSKKLVALRNLQDALLDLETGQRGYLITGDGFYLQAYTRGLADFDTALQRLTGLVHDDRSLLVRVNEIANLGRTKESELARTIRLRRDSGFDAALAMVRTHEGRKTMSEFRSRVRALVVELGDARSVATAKELGQYSKIRFLGAAVIALILLLVGVAIGFLSLSVRRLDELQKQREREAMHDALTGLPNRRYLKEWLDMALAAAMRSRQALAVLYFDLDGFKAVNDRLGHDAGDQVLKVTAARLTSQVRASDFVARLGGDEFVAVLPGAPSEPELSALVERLQSVLSQAPIPELEDGAVAASIGVAWHPEDGGTAETLLDAADRAMYSVKESRRRGAGTRPAPAFPGDRVISVGGGNTA
jgi:diguanylate cyclase (GGDEF)-like protein